ncbi:cytochrome c3 family protein [Thermodesulfobacteriota bacterium]
MSKKSLILLVVAAFVMSLGFGVTMSLADNGPETITLNDGGKKPAVFPHKAHQERAKCGECHHYQDDAGAQVACMDDTLDKIAKCDTCHNADFPNEKLRTWKDIGHGNCKACHTKMKADGAPTKCGACHPKK